MRRLIIAAAALIAVVSLSPTKLEAGKVIPKIVPAGPPGHVGALPWALMASSPAQSPISRTTGSLLIGKRGRAAWPIGSGYRVKCRPALAHTEVLAHIEALHG